MWKLKAPELLSFHNLYGVPICSAVQIPLVGLAVNHSSQYLFTALAGQVYR
jgi:hypothetical protein